MVKVKQQKCKSSIKITSRKNALTLPVKRCILATYTTYYNNSDIYKEKSVFKLLAT